MTIAPPSGRLARAGSPCHVAAVLACVLLSLAVRPAGVRAAEPAIPAWQAGVATVKITPPEPVWMAGYGGRTKPAEGTLSDLWAKVLVLRDAGGKRVALVTLDVCGVDRQTSDRIRDRLRDQLGLGRDAVAVCVSHTHSGPVIGHNLRATYPFGEDEATKIRAYTTWLEDQVAAAAQRAAADLKSASVRYAVGTATFAANRRTNKEADVAKLAAGAAKGAAGAANGSAGDPIRWRAQLKGPVDHDLPVLSVVGGDGKPLAVVFGYACHATVLSGYEWSGDWPGYACEAVERAHPGATAFFVAGCGADQNPLPRRSVELAKRYGGEAAAGVSAALAGGDARAVDGPLATTYGEIDLPFGQHPTREQLEQQKASKDPKDRALARRAAMLLERLARDGKLQESYPYPVQTWRLGPAGPTLVLLGGEVVVDYSLRLKKELGGPGKVWPVGYANDVMAYIPSRRVLDEGGYEGGGAMVYYGQPASWGTEVEERVVAEVRRQVGAK